MKAESLKFLSRDFLLSTLDLIVVEIPGKEPFIFITISGELNESRKYKL